MDTAAVRDRLLGDRRAWTEAVLECAAAVAAGWDGDATTDRERVVPPYRAALDRAGVLDAAPAVLRECVAAAGGSLAADPVAAPPYVVVTGEGLLLRATLDTRLLVRVRAFRLVADGERRRYERAATTPEEAVVVETTD
ncbi:hypothetical protein [Halosegnis marinus]|uniref:DUF7988 domain-containing protein n=1 Tax=Halosegnis marinus TaxID=3034023 RepID=A0ABD5ZP25_9EURY|nr:hypothetical protein [Halosegnis sp. DT85]